MYLFRNFENKSYFIILLLIPIIDKYNEQLTNPYTDDGVSRKAFIFMK